MSLLQSRLLSLTSKPLCRKNLNNWHVCHSQYAALILTRQLHANLTNLARTRLRTLHSSPSTAVEDTKNGQGNNPHDNIIYHGPLTKTFRNLKIFSLSSFGLATAVTPFMFIIDSSLPFGARVALASTAMLTSGLSTTLVAWCGRPYVASVRRLESDGAALQLETTTLALRPRLTTVYDTTFLVETRRPFAKWELAETVRLQHPVAEGLAAGEETVAETLDNTGNIVGRWIVQWSDDGLTGTCRGVGKVVRYFNVHEELLPVSIR